MYQLDAPIKASSSVLRIDSINASAWQHNFPTAKTASRTRKLGSLGRRIEYVFLYKTTCRSPVNTCLLHPGDTAPFQSCWAVPRGKDGLVPSPRIKSQVMEEGGIQNLNQVVSYPMLHSVLRNYFLPGLHET